MQPHPTPRGITSNALIRCGAKMPPQPSLVCFSARLIPGDRAGLGVGAGGVDCVPYKAGTESYHHRPVVLISNPSSFSFPKQPRERSLQKEGKTPSGKQ